MKMIQAADSVETRMSLEWTVLTKPVPVSSIRDI